jgi:hypothetical protein
LKVGAPIVPVAAGMAIAAIVTWRQQRRSDGTPRSFR